LKRRDLDEIRGCGAFLNDEPDPAIGEWRCMVLGPEVHAIDSSDEVLLQTSLLTEFRYD
jgi:hypothetical protein